MDERDSPDRLRDLGARIDKALAGRDPSARKGAQPDKAASGLALGLRIGLELVVAVAVGVGAGLVLDNTLGTRPWGMVGCFFLGVAAGMANVYRTVAGLGMGVGYRKPGSPEPDDKWDED